MKKLNISLIVLISIISLIFTGIFIAYGKYDRILASVSILLVLCLPKIFGKIFKVKISAKGELIYIIFIFIVQLLGSILNLYDYIWWYDLFAHFVSGILTSLLALEVMTWFKVYKKDNKWFNILFMVSFTLMIASFWEFIEFGTYMVFKMDVQHHLTTGVFDTMEDMLMGLLGCIFVNIWYLIKLKTNNKD